MSNSATHESQHTRPPCPSLIPGVHSDSRPSSPWCHPAISTSVVPFFSCPQSLPASESFPVSQLFGWGGQSTGVSASASFPPKKSHGWSPSEWTGWISLQSKGLSESKAEAIPTFWGDSLPPSSQCLCRELCTVLLSNKSYSLSTVSICVFMDFILWLRQQELWFLLQNHLRIKTSETSRSTGIWWSLLSHADSMTREQNLSNCLVVKNHLAFVKHNEAWVLPPSNWRNVSGKQFLAIQLSTEWFLKSGKSRILAPQENQLTAGQDLCVTQLLNRKWCGPYILLGLGPSSDVRL